jgi:amino acid transporter
MEIHAPASPVKVKAEEGLFVRNATGLVRDLSPFDALNLVLAAVLLPVGIIQVMGFAPIFWPHANMFVSFLIATPLVMCFALVCLYFTVLMPRAGGDYIWVSRVLNPGLGFVVNFSVTFVYLTWVAFNFTFMLSIALPGAAYVLGITNTALTSPSNAEMMVIATVLTALFAGLMVIGVKAVARFMLVTFAIVWLGMIAWMLAMLFGSSSDFASAWNAGTGTTPDSIVQQANKLGFSAAGGIDLLATTFGMVYCFQVLTGFQWTGYVAGEVRDIKRAANMSILGGAIGSIIAFTLAVALIYKYYGFQFFGSVVYMGLGGGASSWKQPFQPYLPALTQFLPGPHILAVFIALCFVLAILWWTPAGFLAGTRNLFAWSFDRLAPERLTDVSDRFHTPVVATVFVALVIEVLNYLNIYGGLGAYLLNILVVLGGAFAIVAVAAMLAPYRKPGLHAQAPGWARLKLGSVPVISIIGFVAAASWVFVIYAALSTGFSGTLGLQPMLEALTAPAIAVIWYIGARMYRKNQGIHMERLFQEIPPE